MRDLAAQAREVRPADRRGVDVIQDEVAIRDGVERVGGRRVEPERRRRIAPRQVPVEPRQSAGAEGHLTRPVAGALFPATVG